MSLLWEVCTLFSEVLSFISKGHPGALSEAGICKNEEVAIPETLRNTTTTTTTTNVEYLKIDTFEF